MKLVFVNELECSTGKFSEKMLENNHYQFILSCFSPLVGSLVCPSRPGKPYILFCDGYFGVFGDSVRNVMRDVMDIHPL